MADTRAYCYLASQSQTASVQKVILGNLFSTDKGFAYQLALQTFIQVLTEKNRDNNATTTPSVSNLRSTTRNHVIHDQSSSAQNVAPSCVAENDVNENLLASLSSDPGLRTPIFDYDPNIRDRVRRAYLQRRPCQPKKHTYPTRISGGKPRKFCGSLFNEHPRFRGWRKKERLQLHIEGPKSAHNKALKNCEALMNRKQHIDAIIEKQSEEEKRDNRKRLRASINCVRFLLRQGLAFRGHDETEAYLNIGNFIELLKWLADNNEEIKVVVLENAPGNQKLIASDIQKDITKLRGKVYDEASNIRGEYNGLKALILKDNNCAYFVHCFAHQLQLAVVAVEKKHTYVEELYVVMSYLVNVVAGSAKRQDMLREKQAEAVFEALCSSEILTGRGLNQESTLKRAGDTR
ncbi:uncharacterized protein LOC113335282 [Papaver somniferum]|uniref:uncharacterized protein LOC113335282 n=1 Tax=Papaver somniferum TaxID=3469 RepID=UPI000E703C45|nr:uncharacterized protein LOC113335282 [Papaver somniferum]